MVVRGDNPIKSHDDDTLGRSSSAHNLAAELRELDVSEGSVVAVMGPWGSGKTSLINLVREDLAEQPDLPVVDFNPWMFSGAEQLVEVFFVELAAQLRLKEDRLAKLASEIEAYGELLSPLSIIPFVGGWIDRIRNAGSVIKKFQERRKESVTARRAVLADKLAKLERPIVVVIDDIDRLNTNEIRDIFKLVRLTASFPNVIYLLAFDRVRVEQALSDSGVDGRNYLEKIVQLSVNIPAVRDSILLTQLGRALDEALVEFSDIEPFDQARWQDILAEIIFPLVNSMRDVRRYTASARGTVRALHGRVELSDLLALEAVRIFMPDAFNALVAAQTALTTTRAFGYDGARRDAPHLKAQIDNVLESAGEWQAIARALINRLFPASLRHIENKNYEPNWLKTWIKKRRVAHPDVLGLYLERIAPPGLEAFSDAERAFVLLGNDEALEKYLHSIEPSRLEDVIEALENYEKEYPAEAVAGTLVVLLNLLPELPERRHGMFSPDTRIVVGRVVLRLLEVLSGPEEVAAAAREALPRITKLSSRLELIRIVGYGEDSGHKLVSQEVAAELQAELRELVHAATTKELADDPNVFRLLLGVRWREPEGETTLRVFDDADLNERLLVSALADVRRQSIDSRVVRYQARLHWNALIVLYGNEERLRNAVASVRKNKTRKDPKLEEALELADKYLSGWRPTEFGDDE